MRPLDPREQANLRIVGGETEDHTVPVDVLVQALQGLQQTAVILVAAAGQVRPVERRFRPSERIRQLCQLRCGPLTPGSVQLGLTFAQGGQQEMFLPTQGQPLMQQLLGFVRSVAVNDVEEMARAVPDSRLRARALRTTLNYLPKAGQRWGLELWHGSLPPIHLTQKTREAIEEWFNASERKPIVVTGQLVRIDFEKNRVVIRYLPTNRLLTCDYEVDSEDVLIKNRREWVQAHGRFDLNQEEHPIRVIEVTRIEPLDLSPLEIAEVPYEKTRLLITPPFEFTPVLDEDTSQLLVVEDEAFDILVSGHTREELEKHLISQIQMLWSEYALEDPDNLTPGAQKLRDQLRQRIREE